MQGMLGRAAVEALSACAPGLARLPWLLHALGRSCEVRLRAQSERPVVRNNAAVQRDKLALSLALLELAKRVLAERSLGRPALRGLLRRLVYDVMVGKGEAGPKQRFAARHGSNPPDFLTIGPGIACNLRCAGCYASSGTAQHKLDWATFDRVVTEAHDLWGVRFLVLSGGEPLAWRDSDKGILDMAARHPDVFFLMYSNGTLIDDAVARRLGELGNLSPGISVEGMRETTDARRGTGVFDKVLAAMERLRREGVLFGLSLTATRDSVDEILSDEVVDLFFGRMGALYAWVFHYMPIGRAPRLDLMLTPAQRLRLFRRVWHLVRERRLFITDFWNSATVTNGCVAGGRPGGYLYVDWNGAVSPCVFVPYSPVNIHDVYARGGTLDDVWAEPFFAGVRAWQRRYGYREPGEPQDGCGNWLMPCLIRDHHAEFEALVELHDPRPTDEAAAATHGDPTYHEGLRAFDAELRSLLDPLWEAEYR